MAKSVPSRPTGKRQPAALEGNRPWRERGRVRPSAVVGRDRTVWDRLPSWAQHAVALTVLLAAALWITAPTTFGGRTLVGGDVVQWRGAAQAMLDYEASTGNDALWAPNLFGGMPGFLIQYPPRTPGFDTVPRLMREAGLWPLSHFLVMLAGAYALTFFLTRGKLAAALGALAFSLTTYIPIILIAGHNTKFIALAYAPWLLLAFAAVLYRPDDATWVRDGFLALVFAIAVAVNLRAGHVQITYYAAFLAVVWWVAEGVAALKRGRGGRFTISTLTLAVGAVLGLAMAAQPYLATWVHKAYTMRGAGASGGMAWDLAMAWSQGFGELLTLLVADAFGGGGATYWGPKSFTAGPHYVGPVVLLLAVFGTFGVGQRSTTGIAIGAALMTAFALGEHLAVVNWPMFHFFPLFAAFRAPETWLAMVALALAVLAAYGTYWLARREATPEAEARKTRRVTTGALVGLGVLALVWALGPALLPLGKPDERAQIEQALAGQAGVSPDDPRLGPAADRYLSDLREQRAGMLRGDAGRGFLFLGVAAALMVLFRRGKLPVWAMQGGLVLVVLLDLGGVARRYFNEDDPALRREASVEAAVPRYGFDAFLQERVREAGGPGRFRVLPLVQSPMADGRSSYFYESVGGYHGARLAVFQDFADRVLFTGEAGLNPNGLDLLSTRYVVARGALPGMRPVFQDESTGMLVLENPTALPRAFLVDSVEVVEDEQVLAERIRDPAFEPRRLALISPPVPDGLDLDFYSGPPAPDAAPTPVVPGDTARAAPARPDTSRAVAVELQRFGPREVVYVVRTDRPRLLVASEVFYPDGWHATVSDSPAPILRANYLLRAVPVPAGRHIVTMRFDPPAHQTGVFVSNVSALLVYLGALAFGGLLWYRRGHRRKP